MSKFISCDWGTSNLRVRLVDRHSALVLKEIETNEGIASVNNDLKKQLPETERISFFIAILYSHIQKGFSGIENIPVLISGMASSAIGIIELPYAPMPFRADGSDLLVKKMEEIAAFPFPLFIISGASTGQDVMRGEETLLAGSETGQGQTELFIFPGTHSKHVTVINQVATGIATYMTGEFFALLAKQSILAGSVEEDDTATGSDFFEKGVLKSAETNLLNSVFGIRVNQLLKKATASENFHYLSGLLIGSELAAVRKNDISYITVVSGDALLNKYLAALKLLAPDKTTRSIPATSALVKGHCKIIQTLDY